MTRQRERIAAKVQRELRWYRDAPGAGVRPVVWADEIAERIARELRGEAERVLPVVLAELAADPTVRTWAQVYGQSLRRRRALCFVLDPSATTTLNGASTTQGEPV